MKLKIDRTLVNGLYGITVEVGGFTPDEVRKMALFGIPRVVLSRALPNGTRIQVPVPLNQIKEPAVHFDKENDARNYEDRVRAQVLQSVTKLRESEDKFTSTEEVEL